MAKAERITFKEFRTRFATEEDCRNYMFAQRFPDGFVCPKCGCREYYDLKTRHTCQCRQCRRQTSVTAGTVMHPYASSFDRMVLGDLPLCNR